MYSLKPGRGPSLMGAVGGIVVAIFGVIWTFAAMSMGARPFFAAVRSLVRRHGHRRGGVQLLQRDQPQPLKHLRCHNRQ